ncbi:MAG: carboxylating nicotinate-nucleotide diphosphorylase, partial [Promethearchaeota archaeon]
GSNVGSLVEGARGLASFTKKIEVEVERVDDVVPAAEGGADIIMLDNMTPKMCTEAVDLLDAAGLRNSVVLEASGGINEESIQAYALSGVDVVSCGFITLAPTHVVDLSLRVVT